jgi:hypothetical protein
MFGLDGQPGHADDLPIMLIHSRSDDLREAVM